MKKEYNSNMTWEEVASKIRETMGPYSINPFKSLGKEWVFHEYSNGSFGIEKKLRSRMSGYATLEIFPVDQGTHLILERRSFWKFLCILAFILFEISPPLIYISTRKDGDTGYVVFGVVVMLFIHLLFALLDRWEETDLIDFFVHYVLGIKST